MILTLFMMTLRIAVPGEDSLLTLQGTVADSSSGESIPYANVLIMEDGQGTVADRNGAFVIGNVKRKRHSVRISAMGFQTEIFTINPAGGEIFRVNFLLKESPPTMREVTIFGDSASLRYVTPGRAIISPAEAKTSVSFFKNDLINYVTRLPGVVTLNGLSSRYYVRGGSADENLLTLDGIRIYNFAHAFGMFSFLDPKIVKTATFLAGDFGAEYGNRLSSVMDVRTIDGDKNKITGEGSVDLFTADLEVSGPLGLSPENNSTFVAFYRLPMNRGVLKDIYSVNDRFDFYDCFMKAGTDIGSGGRISAEVFGIGDNVKAERFYDPSYSWDQRAGAISGSFFLGDRHLFNFSFSYSRYKSRQSLKTPEAFQYPQYSEVTEPTITADASYFTDSGNQVDVGLFFSFPTYKYDFTNVYLRRIDEYNPIVEPQFWGSYRWQPTARLVVITGLRADISSMAHLILEGTNEYVLDPRLTLQYKVSDKLLITAGGGTYHQRLINLNDENEVYTAFDVIAPIPDNMGEESAWDCSLGATAAPSPLVTVKADIYMKDFTRLVDINRAQVYASDPSFITGTGFACGAEISLRYNMQSFYFETNYSYGHVTRTFWGENFIPRYDLRHQLNSSVGLSPAAGVWVRAFWKMTSGLPYTPLAGFVGKPFLNVLDIGPFLTTPMSMIPLFGQLNSARLPGYESLDMSIEYDIIVLGETATFQVAAMNLLNRRNVFYFNNVTLDTEYSLPRTVDFSVAFKF